LHPNFFQLNLNPIIGLDWIELVVNLVESKLNSMYLNSIEKILISIQIKLHTMSFNIFFEMELITYKINSFFHQLIVIGSV
jgi:hypothetical protein